MYIIQGAKRSVSQRALKKYGSVTTREPNGKQLELEMKFDTVVRTMVLLILINFPVSFYIVGMRYESEPRKKPSQGKSKRIRAHPGIAPGITYTRSKYHTTRPMSSLLIDKTIDYSLMMDRIKYFSP